MHSASIEFHSGASLCRISRCNLFLHWSCSWPPFLLHSRNRPAQLQHIEMCQSRHSALGLGNASKAALLGQPRITAPNLFIPVTFVGYPLIPPRVRESKRAWRRRDLIKAGGPLSLAKPKCQTETLRNAGYFARLRFQSFSVLRKIL